MEILGLLNVPTWLIGIVVFFLSLILYSKWKLSLWNRLGVPGPPPKLFLGHMGILFSKGWWNADLEFRQKYGKVYGTYMGHLPQFTIADPELVKELLIKRFSSFPNRFRLLEPPKEMSGMLNAALDEHWKFIRNTLTPTFSSGKMRLMSSVINNCCDTLVENLKEKSKNGKEVVEIKHMFGCYTMDVIASTAFGIDVDSQRDPENEFVKHAAEAFKGRMRSPLVVLCIVFPAVAKLFWIFDKLNIMKGPFHKIFQFFNKVTLSIVEDRKAGKEKRQDFMQIMLNAHNETADKEDKLNMVEYKKGDNSSRNRGLTTDELTANAFLFFLAGYDTTSNTMAFLAYNLAMHPECQEKCIEEIDRVIGKRNPDYDNVLKLEYLDNCMNETMRMYGPIAVVNRHVEEDSEIAGYKVPKGTSLNVGIYVIHHDHEYWPDPDKFDPDRFTLEEKAKRHPYAFLAFGHGPRNCIGMRLAYLKTKTAIARILQKYRLVRCEETEDPVILDLKSGLMKAKNGIKLKIEPRKDI